MGVEFRGAISEHDKFRTREHQESLPVPERRLNATSWTNVEFGPDDYRPATSYRVGDTDYFYIPKHGDQPEDVFSVDVWNAENYETDEYRIEDDEIREQIFAQAREDVEIGDSRDALAAEVAGENELLKGILRNHLEFTGGRIEPRSDEGTGVTFYMVGRNASHEFSIGEVDGQRFKMSFGEDGWDEENQEPRYAKHIDEVDDWGYMGHY
jgi:hypothetical protein